MSIALAGQPRLTQRFEGSFVGGSVGTQKNGGVVQVHVERDIAYLVFGVVGGFNGRDVPVVGLLVGFWRDEFGHQMDVGRADNHVGGEGQIFDVYIEDETLGQGGHDLAGYFHRKIVTDAQGALRARPPKMLR